MITQSKSILLVLLLTMAAGAANAAGFGASHVQTSLVPAAASVKPGGTVYIALRQKITGGWHTYWRNPGDAGEAPKIVWTLPPGWKAGDIVWPMPKRLPVGPLMDYGYEDQVYLPVPVTAPKSAKAGQSATLKAAVSLLVCKDVCVPEDATLSVDLPVTATGAPTSNPAVVKALASAPRSAPLKAAMSVKGGKLELAVAGPAVRGVAVKDAYFFPYDSTVIDHAKPETLDRGPQGLTLTMAPGYAFTHGKPPVEIRGALQVGGKAYEVAARTGPLPAGVTGLGSPAQAAGGGQGVAAAGAGGLLMAAGLAFLGGAILNLMPCVFPILSMKAVALASHRQEGARPRAEGLAFLAGVLITFMALAAALIAAKAAGAEVGWGFQLQSPGVVAGLALVMLLIGLDLSGVFEAGLSLQGAGSGATGHGGLLGSALVGALAVVVAAPCTAPFMAGAVAYALTQSSEWSALAVFAGLGLGFAAPFVILSFAPRLLALIPRPGPWMDGFKKVLAFPMYGAAAWLVWVLTLQAGTAAMAALLGAGVALAFAAWVYGAAQRAQASGRRPFALYGVSLVAVVAALGVTAAGLGGPAPAAAAPAGSAALASEPYSPGRLAELTSAGRPVLVDFTAAWCITCQVNERVALSGDKVAKAFAQTNAVYLRADWTRRDPQIAEALAAHGRAGVPLYLVYGKGGGQPQVLPQILTESTVIAAIQKAAKA